MRILMTKDVNKFRSGETVEVGIAEGNDLLKDGSAELTKDMRQSDSKTKSVPKRGKNGRFSNVRTNKSK